MGPSQREALLAVFRSTGGAAGWERKDNWDTESEVSQWHGIQADGQGYVKRLRLGVNNLRGNIPRELGDLSSLESLWLDGNRLTGPIPPETGNLTALKYLTLWRNDLSGSIPSAMGNLTALKFLTLRQNRLDGPIPPEMGNLTALKYLTLRQNRLSGSIPPEMGNLTALKYLTLRENQLDGLIPEELGNLAALTHLWLFDNQLEGRIPKELGALSKLQLLNLSRNRLTGSIPPELGKLSALGRLELYSNKLSGPITKELGGLTNLQLLDLRFNKLTGSIPEGLGNLPALTNLWLNNNSLEGNIPKELGALNNLKLLMLSTNKLTGSIPPELGNMGALVCLNASENELGGTIPKELGALTNMQMLILSKNKLTGPIPEALGRLIELTTLELSGNQLSALWDHTQDVPHTDKEEGAVGVSGGRVPGQLQRLLDMLERVDYLRLGENPWAEPPESIVDKGAMRIRGYFEDIYAEPHKVQRNIVKVILVGQEGAGKTSLRQSMKANKAAPTGDWKEESTVFADVDSMEIAGSSIRLYDCAGQVAYTGLLQMFLTPRSVCLLVCDAKEFEKPSSGTDGQVKTDYQKLEDLRVCDWLRSLSRRVPCNDAILVATKCDRARGSCRELGRRMEHACRTWLASWVRDGMQPVGLEDGVCLTSCYAPAMGEQDEIRAENHVPEVGWACDWKVVDDEYPSPSLLHRLVNKPDGSGLRGARVVLPRSWDIALTVLEALERGRDPTEAVVQKLANPDGGDSTEAATTKTGVYQGITVEELSAQWQETVLELARRHIEVMNAENALEGALSIREFEGSLVRFGNYIFLDVIWLARILKPLLNHKDEESFDGFVKLGDTIDTQITLDDPGDIASWGRLKGEGILEPRLAKAMWPAGLSEYVLPTLGFLGLTFPLEKDPAGGLVVLLRLKPERPLRVGKVIDTFCLENTPVFGAVWKIFLGVPAGAIEKVLTLCCSLGSVRTFWRCGVLVHGKSGDRGVSGAFAVVLEYLSANNELTAQVYGNIRDPAPWAAISYVISAVKCMLLEFPGLRSRGSLACPEHGNAMPMDTGATRPGDELLLENTRCPQCSPETMGQGAAAVELLRMVDIRLDRDVIYDEVKARLVNLADRYPFLLRTTNAEDDSILIEKMDNLAVVVQGGFDVVKNEVKGELKAAAGAMKAGFDEVAGGAGEIKGGLSKMRGDLKEGLKEMQGDFSAMKGGLNEVNKGLQQVERRVKEVKGGFDKVMEIIQESLTRLEDLQAPNYAYPHLVVMKEAGPGDASSRPPGKKSLLSKLRGMATKEMALHFLCPVDMSEVTMVTAKVALKATSGLDIEVSNSLQALRDGMLEELVDRTLDEDALSRIISGEEVAGSSMQRDARASYDALKHIVDKEQVKRLKTARDDDDYVDFREVMQRVSDGKGGLVWVRTANVEKWLHSLSNAAPSR